MPPVERCCRHKVTPFSTFLCLPPCGVQTNVGLSNKGIRPLVKPGFHYPSWRRELTGDQFPLPVNTGRFDGRAFPLASGNARPSCWQVMETGHPLTWAVNSGSGNRALVRRCPRDDRSQFLVAMKAVQEWGRNSLKWSWHISQLYTVHTCSMWTPGRSHSLGEAVYMALQHGNACVSDTVLIQCACGSGQTGFPLKQSSSLYLVITRGCGVF